jgi:L-malate glycosyltransferase
VIDVTFLIGSLDVGGAERQLVRLVNALDPERYAPRILTLWAGGPLGAEVRPGIPVTHLNLGPMPPRKQRWRFVAGTGMLLGLHRELRSTRPRILHAYLPTAYMMGALAGRAAGVRVIVAGRRGLASYRTYPQLHWRLIGRLANRIVAMHVCNSEAVRSWVLDQEGLPAARTCVVPNGIDPPGELVRELEPGWRAPVRIAMIANLIGYKGHDTVLRALGRVVRDHPEVKLVLFGEGPERPALERQRDELGLAENVVFAGRRPDAAQFLPGFDLSLLGSAHEGFPNAIMEAMAYGLPVVATAVGGVPELIEDGVQGRLVPPADPARMASAIAWMIEHPAERARMGAAGRERVTREFGTAAMVRRTQAVYESLVGGR